MRSSSPDSALVTVSLPRRRLSSPFLAAGALAVLFARSYARAGEIHRAMLARGFPGYFRPLIELHFHPGDVMFLALGVLTPVVLRLLIERVA